MTTSFSGDDNTNSHVEQKGAFDSDTQGQDNRTGVDTEGRPSVDEQLSKLNKRLSDKDEFIETLKSERRQDRERLEQMEAMMRKLEDKLGKETSIAEVINGMKNQPNQQSEKTSQIDLDKLVERAKTEALTAVEQKQLESTYQNNFSECARLVQQVYGADKVDSKIREIARDNDLTFEDAVEMAKTKPKAFRRLFVPEGTKANDSAPLNGSVQAAAFKGNQQSKPTKLYRDINSEKARMQLVQEKFRELTK